MAREGVYVLLRMRLEKILTAQKHNPLLPCEVMGPCVVMAPLAANRRKPSVRHATVTGQGLPHESAYCLQLKAEMDSSLPESRRVAVTANTPNKGAPC